MFLNTWKCADGDAFRRLGVSQPVDPLNLTWAWLPGQGEGPSGKVAEPIGMAPWSPLQLRGLVGRCREKTLTLVGWFKQFPGVLPSYIGRKSSGVFFYGKGYCCINDHLFSFCAPPVRDHCKNDLWSILKFPDRLHIHIF